MTSNLPPATVEWVFPPNREYEYFQRGGDHPFLSAATNFEVTNAWWLAEASLLAYAAPDFAVPVFTSAGFTVANDGVFSGPSTQCYVVYTDEVVIVAFRGTQVYKPCTDQKVAAVIRDVIADCSQDGRFGLVTFAEGGHVHRGFLAALDEIWDDQLRPCLDRLRDENPGRTFWFTGHSLGAALATLAAARCPQAANLYTYGSPFVGDEEFKKAFPVAGYRFVNNNDIVPTVPPVGPYLEGASGVATYRHVGYLKYINSDGRITDDPAPFKLFFDGLRGRFQHFFTSLEQFQQHWILELPDDGLNDHGPVYYAIRLKLGL